MMLQYSDTDRFLEDPLGLFSRLHCKLYTIWLSLTYPFATIGRNLSVHYTCLLNRKCAPAIKLGNSIGIGKDAWLNVFDITQGKVAAVIDDNCHIGSRCVISAKNSIHLERDVLIAGSVLIMDHNHAYEDTTLPILKQGVTQGGTIRIGEGSWIGHGAVIVCSRHELTVGRNCVIGANAVVTRSLPPYSVAVGNPARVIRSFDLTKQAWIPGSEMASNYEGAQHHEHAAGTR